MEATGFWIDEAVTIAGCQMAVDASLKDDIARARGIASRSDSWPWDREAKEDKAALTRLTSFASGFLPKTQVIPVWFVHFAEKLPDHKAYKPCVVAHKRHEDAAAMAVRLSNSDIHSNIEVTGPHYQELPAGDVAPFVN